MPGLDDELPVRRSGPSLWLRRVVHALANHGPMGFIKRAAGRVFGRTKPDLAGSGMERTRPHPFDLAHGVDTSGYIPGERLEGPAAVHTGAGFWNTAYYAISPSTLTHALALLPEPVAGFTFVDLGCGMGRALLIAEQFGFGQAVGAELSPELAAKARQNAAGRPARIEVREDDAVTTIYPAGPLVIFLYSPFLRPLFRRVLANLERQLRQAPRPVYLLFANPGYQQILRQTRWLTEVWDFSLRLSEEDAAADRHGITHERYTLYEASAP